MGVHIGKGAKNPYTLSNVSLQFAVTDSRKTESYSLQSHQIESISHVYTESKDITEDEKWRVTADWNQLIQKASSKRQKRHILTENIVAAANTLVQKTNSLNTIR